MDKLYRVTSNVGVEEFGVKLGDVCSLKEHFDDDCAWFQNTKWCGDGVWCLEFSNVEEIVEEN